METKNTLERIRNFKYVLVFEGAVMGVIAGAFVSVFRILIDKVQILRGTLLGSPYVIPFYVICFLAVCLLLKWDRNSAGSGIPQVRAELLGRLDSRWYSVLIAKIVGGAAAIGAGLSVGREGPSVQIGAMAAKGMSRFTKRMPMEERSLITAGAGAGLAAAFNAPLAGVVFSLEEIHKNLSSEIMLTSLAACVTSDFVSSYIFGLSPIFNVVPDGPLPLRKYWMLIIFGAVLGLFGVFYNLFLKFIQKAYSYLKYTPVKIGAAFVFAVILARVYPYVLGGGSELVDELAKGESLLPFLFVLLIVKFLFSMISFGSGTQGGIFLPLLVMGAILGNIFADISGQSEFLQNFIILGMAGLFTSIVRSPITGIILISEMTGSLSHLLSLSLVCLISYVVSDALRSKPVYDQLMENIIGKSDPDDVAKILVEGTIGYGSRADGITLADLALPKGALVISIEHKGEEIVPSGSTVLEGKDKLLILCDNSLVYDVRRHLDRYTT